MSAHVASELVELFQNLLSTVPSSTDDGLGLARQWVASLDGDISVLAALDGGHATSAGDAVQVVSPFDSSLAVRVRPGSSVEHEVLRMSWFPAQQLMSDSEEEDEAKEKSQKKKETCPFDFLTRWARSIERHANLVASVVAAFSGSCLSMVRQSELPRALQDIRYWAGRCPLDVPAPIQRHNEAGAPLPHTCQLFVTSPAAALRTVTREVAAAFASGWRQHRVARVVVSANANSGAAPIAHLLVQLALLDCAGKPMQLASLPVLTSSTPLGDCVVLGDPATPVTAAASGGAVLSAVKVAPRGGARGVTIVCESADLFAAAEAALDSAALWCAGQLPGSGHLVLVQESTILSFSEQITERMGKRHVAPSPQGDVGFLTTDQQKRRLADALSAARADGAETEKLGVMVDVGGAAPFLITGAQPASTLACMETQEGLDGAFIYILPFRTAKEALKLANHAPRRLRASLWCEVPAQAWEMAQALNFQHVEVNCVRPFDPRVEALVDSPEEWVLRGDVELSSSETGGASHSSPHGAGGLFRSENAPSSGASNALAAAAKAAAKWAAVAPEERRSILRPIVAALAKTSGDGSGCHLEDLVLGADDLAAGRTWPVKQSDFAGNVTVQRSPRGVIAFLCDANFPLTPLCEAVLRAVLFGNAVVIVTARSHAAVLTQAGLAKLEAVTITPYPEDSPDIASEALATDLCSATESASVLFHCSLPVARLLGRIAVANQRRFLCLGQWGQKGVSRDEAEVLRDMCVQHKAIWNPVLDAFAN